MQSNAMKSKIKAKRNCDRTRMMMVCHIGALQCANCFHSQNWHTVLSQLDSQDPGTLGMLAGVVVWLILASDMANADKCCGQCRPVFLLTQASDRGELWPMYVTVVADACQNFW